VACDVSHIVLVRLKCMDTTFLGTFDTLFGQIAHFECECGVD
jgi:hypothetical protein